jgi:UDP-N-acetylglucosamine--N-acetylmuramyl-(pentapeptide) pyrophosphoryl-undecaprenol N-acetylglucosamine transferase
MNRVVISGGGSGGHILPALAIADEIKKRYPACDILFVGALGKMEMDKVPAAGYRIEGLPITGLQRSFRNTSNLRFPFKLLASLIKAGRIVRSFRPEAAVGVGGFASGPLLFRASLAGIPTLIQEQNSFPGITNRLLARRVDRICAGFPGLERWFPADRIVLTGNPVRGAVTAAADRAAALEAWGLRADRPVLAVLGGSLGAATMNAAVRRGVEEGRFGGEGMQVIWQCGARFEAASRDWLAAQGNPAGVVCRGFVDRMDQVYAAADAVAARAGAMTLAELAIVGKPCVLVPSPSVAEDHQTRNARALVDLGGALLIEDSQAPARLAAAAAELLADPQRCAAMAAALRGSARPDAAARVVDALEDLVRPQAGTAPQP